ncbi:gephyrin-like molybdotransferase Glp [Paenibacillus xerothermodurans]|uniref:Molybdopterin molybdenumtransferase n=1 Tax=Paenibacillus xerothermodurans TaxID=1977292 RepID=A0A2W1NTX9_PAEXE|nr:gephyrin-like molybdotransferase Glp [Paenibacillus xerothermodurans]PZE21186.1 molybdopterin molybdenumtransferase MoeA [Paenibacillus xerothermodurans]
MSGFRFQRKLVQVEEAQQAVLRYARLQAAERVPLAESFGRRLAEPVAASHPVPHFRRSGVDGYAVYAADSVDASPDRSVSLQVTEMIPAGSMPSQRVERGQAARIMTGAAVPDGADAVIMLEMTESSDDEVRIRKRMSAGENITPIGQEVLEGEPLLQPGRTLGAGEAAVLATFGYEHVNVYRKPRVAIFSTGSELLEVGSQLQPSKIRNSNSYMIASLVHNAGAVPLIMPILPDEPEQVEQALLDVLEEVDCIVTTGGVSVGDKDVLVDLFERWDGLLLFNKVAMRPGSPTSVGVWRDKLIFALSGNPGASFVGFQLFVRPFLRSAMGHPRAIASPISGFIGTDYSKGSAYPRYVRGVMKFDNGQVNVKPAGEDKSSIMVSIKDADCLIYIPAGGRGAAAGDQVRIFPIND